MKFKAYTKKIVIKFDVKIRESLTASDVICTCLYVCRITVKVHLATKFQRSPSLTTNLNIFDKNKKKQTNRTVTNLAKRIK